jgi:hypothetical protein
LRPYFPGGILSALAAAREGSIPPTPSIQRLRPGLPGYLIPFAPLAFAPQRQFRPRPPPSPPVFFRISTHSTATPEIPWSSAELQIRSIQRPLPGERWRFHVRLADPPTSPLRPIIPNNACPLRLTAAAGTELAGAYSPGTVNPTFTKRAFFPRKSGLQAEALHPARGVARSPFRALSKPLDCCPP